MHDVHIKYTRKDTKEDTTFDTFSPQFNLVCASLLPSTILSVFSLTIIQCLFAPLYHATYIYSVAFANAEYQVC